MLKYNHSINPRAKIFRIKHNIFVPEHVFQLSWSKYKVLLKREIREQYLYLGPLHYASIPIERSQLEFWVRLIPLPPFWSSLIISDKIFGDCQLRSFTFEWYLGSTWTQSSSETKINCSSSSLQTGCEWNVGTSWTLASKECIKYFGHEKNSQNICIFQIPFSQWWAPQTKKLFWDVFLSTH